MPSVARCYNVTILYSSADLRASVIDPRFIHPTAPHHAAPACRAGTGQRSRAGARSYAVARRNACLAASDRGIDAAQKSNGADCQQGRTDDNGASSILPGWHDRASAIVPRSARRLTSHQPPHGITRAVSVRIESEPTLFLLCTSLRELVSGPLGLESR
jgi:hypothetical protein